MALKSELPRGRKTSARFGTVAFLVFVFVGVFIVGAVVQGQMRTSEESRFALYQASMTSNVAEVKRALEAGADANSRFSSQDRERLYVTSVSANEKYRRIASLWWDHARSFTLGAKPRRYREQNASIFYWSVFQSASDPRNKNKKRIVAAFLEHGADPNRLNDSPTPSSTPLTVATSFGDATLTRLLLSRGASPAMPNRKGETPLQAALRSKDRDTITAIRRALAASPPEGREPGTQPNKAAAFLIPKAE